MKIFIISSAAFYDKIKPIKDYLESKGFIIDYVKINKDGYYQTIVKDLEKGYEAHAKLVQKLFKMSEEKIKRVDAVLCINFEKNNIENYIGGATFIEIYEAFKNNKKIYLYHDIPKGMLFDEIASFEPIVINENLDLIK